MGMNKQQLAERIWNSANNMRSKIEAVLDILKIVRPIPMTGAEDYERLGFIYEYLIGNFAANAGKKAGEFYTPHEVAILMSEIIAWELRDQERISIYDPTSGSGSLLLTIGQSVARHNGDPTPCGISPRSSRRRPTT